MTNRSGGKADGSGETARQIWDGFRAAGRPLRTTLEYLPLHDAVSLFHQSTRAYDEGLYELAALGCRAALESACYVFLTTERLEEGAYRGDAPRSLDGKIRLVTLTEISAGIRARRILSTAQLAAFSAIKDHGDLVAHFSAKTDKAMEKFALKLTKPASPDTPGEGFEKGLAPLEVLVDLRAGADILLSIGTAWASESR